ncbi:MAG: HDOD domain-containing protein [Kineosporiaceae bacterium]
MNTARERVRARQELASRAGAALRVLQLADDPDTSAGDLARAISTDPLFAARVLRTANAAYYGLSGRVSTLAFAVSVMGFQGVRSLAVMAAAGVDDSHGAPDGFWRAAAMCATGGEIVAPMLGADPGDAFSVGLLHMIGSALLHQSGEPGQVHLCLPIGDDDGQLLADENEVFEIGHDALGAEVLESWHFPPHIYQVIGRHHQSAMPDAPALERTLQIARSLTDAALSEDGEVPDPDSGYAWLSEGVIGATVAESIMERMQMRAEALLEGLRPGG